MKAGKKTKVNAVKKGALASMLALAIAVPIPFSTAFAATNWVENGTLDKNGKFDNPYTNLEDALADARAKHEEVVNEGTTLVKNNGLLPLNVSQEKKITLFNSAPALVTALEGVGFNVNDISPQTTTTSGLEGGGDNTNQKGEEIGNKGVITEFSAAQQKTVAAFGGGTGNGGTAVVRIFRTAGEANDLSTGRSLNDSTDRNTGAVTSEANDKHFGDITWVNGDGQKVEWTKEAAEAGTIHEAWPDGTPKDWNHENLAPNEPLARYGAGENISDRDLTPVRHALMLTLDEEKMIQLAKKTFDNVIVVYDSITQFEMWDLEQDEDIDAIIVSGRMTTTSVNNPSLWAARGVARVISGEVNPSSYLVSQWDRDMTADPTWQNFGDNLQNDSVGTYFYSDGTPTGPYTRAGIGGGAGLHGVDYEEGIYLGYKYYETYWYETSQGNTELTKDVTDAAERQRIADQWHHDHVTYPFGYGLSYTDFDYEITEVTAGQKLAADATVQGSKFASTASKAADIQTIEVKVKVTNVGAYAGKAVAQLYATAPYVENGVEKPYVKLVGFEKTDTLKPGKSQTVTVTLQVQDIASFDYEGRANTATQNYTGYILDEGEYTLWAMNSSSVLRSTAKDDFKFNISNGGKAVELTQDDYSGNVVNAIFSTPNTMEYTIRDENIMADGGTGMTILSRSDLDGTFPKAPEITDVLLDDNYIDDYVRSTTSYVAGATRTRAETGLTTPKSEYNVPKYDATTNAWYYDADKGDYSYLDDENDPWYLSVEELNTLTAAWTQEAQATRDNDKTGEGAAIKLREMAGVPLYVTENGEQIVNPLWTEFLNGLTYLELQVIASCGNTRLARIDSIDKNRSAAHDNTSVIANIYHWGDQPLLARTWNKQLAADHGRLTAQYAVFGKNSPTGWWSPGCNIHRSPFSGRNGDYYGQDAVQAGLILSAVTEAAEENGLACWIKHFVLNDQETNRNGLGLFTWGDEQTFRENYFVTPQKAFQEGHASGNMQSFARIGGVVFAYSYGANTELMRHQWGWTGISVTDMLMGAGVTAYTVAEQPLNAYEAAVKAETGVTKFDTTKNWTAGRTVTLDQLVRGATGLPDATPATEVRFDAEKGEYVYGVGSADRNTGINNYWDAENKTVKTVMTPASTNSNPVSGIWKDSFRGGKGGVYLEHEAGASTAAEMTISGHTQWYYVRTTAMYACYEAANSYGNRNGMLVNDASNQLRNYHNTTLTVEGLIQGVAADPIDVAIKDDTCGNKVVYSVVSGKLPAGLTLNSETGVISGTPMEAVEGDTQVVIECRVANYLYGNKTVTIKSVAQYNAPYIGEDGYWYVNGEKTNIKAEGSTGPAGEQGPKGDTGAQGPQGEKGEAGSAGEGGCGSVIGAASAFAVTVAILGGAVLAIRKKKD